VAGAVVLLERLAAPLAGHDHADLPASLLQLGAKSADLGGGVGETSLDLGQDAGYPVAQQGRLKVALRAAFIQTQINQLCGSATQHPVFLDALH
jgi:hypothetical protein